MMPRKTARLEGESLRTVWMNCSVWGGGRKVISRDKIPLREARNKTGIMFYVFAQINPLKSGFFYYWCLSQGVVG